MPIVSIIIPTANRFQLLERALRSILNQTFNDYEIIVVDDASVDKTQSAIKSLNIPLNYIRLEKKFGGAVARNTGIEKSTGKFIAFLDDDDEWLPEKLSRQVAIIENTPSAGICYTGRKIIKHSPGFFGLSKKYSFKYPPDSNHYQAIMSDNFIGVTSSVLIPRSILANINGFDENLPAFQDYDLYIRILKRYISVGIDEPLVKYYLGESGRHVSFAKENIRKASKYLLEKYKDDPYYSHLKKALYIINLKKMFKSFAYAKDVFRME